MGKALEVNIVKRIEVGKEKTIDDTLFLFI